MDRLRHHRVCQRQQHARTRRQLQPVRFPHLCSSCFPLALRKVSDLQVSTSYRIEFYQTPAISVDAHYGVASWKLEMAQLSGEPLNPMWKVLNPPSMLPTDVLHIRVSSPRPLLCPNASDLVILTFPHICFHLLFAEIRSGMISIHSDTPTPMHRMDRLNCRYNGQSIIHWKAIACNDSGQIRG